MGMRLGTWNVKNPDRLEPLRTVARELVVYRLALAGLQIRWDKGGTESADDYIFYENCQTVTGFFIHQRIT
jgi:hypothetical protein